MAKRSTTAKASAPRTAARAPTRPAETAAEARKVEDTTRPQDPEPEGQHTKLATPEYEAALRKARTSAAGVKKAAEEGKKDPIAKFGDPNADPAELAARRSTFG